MLFGTGERSVMAIMRRLFTRMADGIPRNYRRGWRPVPEHEAPAGPKLVRGRGFARRVRQAPIRPLVALFCLALLAALTQALLHITRGA